jgi:hypothetical protein
MLEAIARKQLVKTAGWKRFRGYCCDLYSVEISNSVIITCNSEWCVEVVSNFIHQYIPRL